MVKGQSVATELAVRSAKNQLIIRGSGIVGSGMQKAGAALIAESVRRSQTPMIHKTDMFDYNTKQFYRQRHMTEVGTYGNTRVSTTTWEPNPRVQYAKRYVFGPSEAEQEKRWEKKRQLAEKRRVQVPRRAGIISIAFGRAIPTLASGYVVYKLLKGEQTDFVKPQDPWGVTPIMEALPGAWTDFEDLQKDQVEAVIEGSTLAGFALRTGFTVGVGFLTGLFS